MQSRLLVGLESLLEKEVVELDVEALDDSESDYLFDDETGKELFSGVELLIGELTHIVNDAESSVSFGFGVR